MDVSQLPATQVKNNFFHDVANVHSLHLLSLLIVTCDSLQKHICMFPNCENNFTDSSKNATKFTVPLQRSEQGQIYIKVFI